MDQEVITFLGGAEVTIERHAGNADAHAFLITTAMKSAS